MSILNVKLVFNVDWVVNGKVRMMKNYRDIARKGDIIANTRKWTSVEKGRTEGKIVY